MDFSEFILFQKGYGKGKRYEKPVAIPLPKKDPRMLSINAQARSLMLHPKRVEVRYHPEKKIIALRPTGNIHTGYKISKNGTIGMGSLFRTGKIHPLRDDQVYLVEETKSELYLLTPIKRSEAIA